MMTREELLKFIDTHLDEILDNSLPSGTYHIMEPFKMKAEGSLVLAMLKAMQDGCIEYRE